MLDKAPNINLQPSNNKPDSSVRERKVSLPARLKKVEGLEATHKVKESVHHWLSANLTSTAKDVYLDRVQSKTMAEFSLAELLETMADTYLVLDQDLHSKVASGEVSVSSLADGMVEVAARFELDTLETEAKRNDFLKSMSEFRNSINDENGDANE